ncbi:unnamed protein product, partial [Rotaria magnacalcarata]
MGIQYYKKQRAPKYTDKQLEEIPTRAQRLYHMLSNNDFEFIMDDEKYFLLQDQSVPTNRGSYTSDKRTTAPQIKFKRIQKFEPKAGKLKQSINYVGELGGGMFANKTFANNTFANGEVPPNVLAKVQWTFANWRKYSGRSPIGEVPPNVLAK